MYLMCMVRNFLKAIKHYRVILTAARVHVIISFSAFLSNQQVSMELIGRDQGYLTFIFSAYRHLY